jgi:hypothetical protein
MTSEGIKQEQTNVPGKSPFSKKQKKSENNNLAVKPPKTESKSKPTTAQSGAKN